MREVKKQETHKDEEDETYCIDVFHINQDCAFKVEIVTNRQLVQVIADTGAKISVCGSVQAKKWNIFYDMSPSKVKIKPYKSAPIQVLGAVRNSATFGTTSVPIVWHVIEGSCDTILDGHTAEQLGIIKFHRQPVTFKPINLIKTDNNAFKVDIQACLQNKAHIFSGIGNLKNHQVKLHVDPTVKPVNVPSRSVPYHLQERTNAVLNEMIENNIIEEHPNNMSAPWVSNPVIEPKPDGSGSLRVTLDARNVNKALISSNHPIPRYEDIKSKIAGSTVFSKLDFKSAFWQIDLEESSRYLTVFHANNKLYRYKRLTMGLKPSQGELNAALTPIFSHINGVHLIHDDVVIATSTNDEHLKAVKLVLQAVDEHGLTLNPQKCIFAKDEIKFWGVIIDSDGIKPDPEKVDALRYIERPTNKQELVSFLCMMQANAEFISNFSKKSAILRELTKKHVHFQWQNKHQQTFEELLQEFRKDTLMRYFDMSLNTFIFTDAHPTGLGVILAQGTSIETAKPVAVASRATTPSESKYAAIDLEAMGIDLGLRRFRNYLVGSPNPVQIITDHKPLCPVFNSNRAGSIRAERIKLRHQDIRYTVNYRKGKLNLTDYISRHAKPMSQLSTEEKAEAKELDSLLYLLHSTPVTNAIGLKTIAYETAKDTTLKDLKNIINNGYHIRKSDDPKIQRYKQIIGELLVSSNGIILKADRIVLPESLQQLAIELAHRGSHPGQSGIERRLRSHFYFPDMYQQVKIFVQQCPDCQLFTDKKTTEPQKAHQVPDKNWETVAVDLFGPMPSSHHVVVVQDLASRYPCAKLVASTSASSVLPALSDIYNTMGSPQNQLSDNGSPFQSAAMHQFA